MKKFKQHLFALFTMIMGTALVMGLVYMMNEATTTPPKADQKDAVAFQVDKKPPPKKVRKRTPRKKRVKRAARSAAAPPALASNLGGPSFDLPQFAGTDLTSGGSKLLKSKSSNLLNNESAIKYSRDNISISLYSDFLFKFFFKHHLS